MISKRIFILSAHVYSEASRKASIHFVAEQWAKAGHQVSFTTVGYSWINMFRRAERFHVLRKSQNNRYRAYSANLECGAYLPLVHGFSTSRSALKPLSNFLMRRYGAHLPAFIADRARVADLIVIESGTPIIFVELLRRLNPSAQVIYFCRDLLRSVGASELLVDTERRLIAAFDAVCVPSMRLGQSLPQGGRVVYIPQGIEKEAFARAEVSPYDAGTLNAVAAGDMLFDRQAVEAMALAMSSVTFHLFGIAWEQPAPANVRLHGEMNFEMLAAFVRHADFGIAPYRYSEKEAYLAESSLKLLQYSHCGLPIVLPDTIPVARGNEVRYGLGADWRTIIERAIAMRREGVVLKDEIPSWNEVAARVLDAVETA